MEVIMSIKNNSERGQIIVYLAIGMVIFLGFVALAIDGGYALADRRRSQNAADASSLAGGAAAALTLETHHITSRNWSCYIPAISNANDTAISRASANNFSIDTNLDDYNGVETKCGSQDFGYFNDIYMDVTVDISATTRSNFAQLIFPNALNNKVEAVTRVRPRQPIVYGNALVALSHENCQGNQYGALFLGTGDTNITGGGVFSNGCIRGQGSAKVTVTDGDILGRFPPAYCDPSIWSPCPQQTNFQIPESNYDITVPARDSHGNCIGGWNGSDLPQDPTVMHGLYCVRNPHGKMTLHGTYRGTGVTIVILEGGLDINSTSDIQISAPDATPDPSPAIPGLLLYVPSFNPSDITLNGTSGSFFEGTIIAPRSYLMLDGDAADYVKGQVIGWTVKVTGTNGFSIDYNPDEGYQKPTAIELAK
jgi:Putative Flp pilus-assembly TadE/G-like